MLLLPSGKKVWPILGFYRDTLPVRQRQVIQKSLEEVELRLVVQRPLSGSEEEQARATLREKLGHPFRVTISYHDEIPRSRGGKFEEFRCEVTDQRPGSEIGLS
jgi:phenylacetate-CoA ligase